MVKAKFVLYDMLVGVTVFLFSRASGGDDLKWTYKLEDGCCTDSMALATARHYGIEPSIVERALQLRTVFDTHCRGGSVEIVCPEKCNDDERLIDVYATVEATVSSQLPDESAGNQIAA